MSQQVPRCGVCDSPCPDGEQHQCLDAARERHQQKLHDRASVAVAERMRQLETKYALDPGRETTPADILTVLMALWFHQRG